jgi:hypothetical protein
MGRLHCVSLRCYRTRDYVRGSGGFVIAIGRAIRISKCDERIQRKGKEN